MAERHEKVFFACDRNLVKISLNPTFAFRTRFERLVDVFPFIVEHCGLDNLSRDNLSWGQFVLGQFVLLLCLLLSPLPFAFSLCLLLSPLPFAFSLFSFAFSLFVLPSPFAFCLLPLRFAFSLFSFAFYDKYEIPSRWVSSIVKVGCTNALERPSRPFECQK